MATSSSAYRGQSVAKTHLKWDVFVTPSIPVVTTDFAPGEQERPWPPISSTLIYGSRDAVVVDSFITLEQARAQADWIGSTGKNLITIYATHGHGDHFFGASVLLERFPNARFVAASNAIQVMKEQTSPEFVAKFWESRFPHQLPKHLVVAEELRTNLIELEGERLVVIPLGFTDTAETTCLHAPSLQLIAARDAAYKGVHPRLMEANQNQKRGEWFPALDKMESLKPRVVVAGHKNMKNDNDAWLERLHFVQRGEPFTTFLILVCFHESRMHAVIGGIPGSNELKGWCVQACRLCGVSEPKRNHNQPLAFQFAKIRPELLGNHNI